MLEAATEIAYNEIPSHDVQAFAPAYQGGAGESLAAERNGYISTAAVA